MKISEIVAQLGGELRADPQLDICQVASLESAGPGQISFLSNPRYTSSVASSRAAVIIVDPSAADGLERPLIVTRGPYLYFARVAQLLNPPEPLVPGIAATSSVAPDAVVAASASIGPGTHIGRHVCIGEHTRIGANCSIGDGVRIGPHTVINASVSIYRGCVLGQRCIVHSGVVIGADGFGFARQSDGVWEKIPQIGRVVIGDDVEIGANTTIDRGALDDTVIEDGVKLDNQIQIAHNVRIGAHTAIAGCVGIAGSTRIGKRCMIAGAAMIIGHLDIADDVVVSVGTVVMKSIDKPGTYTGTLPFMDHRAWARNFSHLRQLDDMAERLRKLEKKLADDSSNQEDKKSR